MVAKKKKIVAKKPVKKATVKVMKTKKSNTKKAATKKNAKKINKGIKTVAKKTSTKKSKKSTKKKLTQQNQSKKVATVKKAAPTKRVAAKTIAKPVKKTAEKPQQAMEGMKKIISKKPVMIPVIKESSMFLESQDTHPKKPTTLLGALEFAPYQLQENEVYMNEHQRDYFQKILMAWKQQLMQDVDTTVGHLKEEAVFYADPVDRASQEEGFNLELRTRDRERRLIKKIEQSLDLINTNEYGFCEDCGAEIGIRRLEARPTAVKCIDCKTFQEIREKQLGG